MKPQFDHEKLRAYREALRFVAWVAQISEEIPAKLSSNDQLDRASTSIVLNIAEGSGKRSYPDRCRYFDSARGSALESAACLDVLLARGKIGPEVIVIGKEILLGVVSLLADLIARFGGNEVREKPSAYAETSAEENENDFFMSLTLATLLPGLVLIALGLPLLARGASVGPLFKAFPRSHAGAVICFGGGALWFLFNVWNLSAADFGDYHVILTIGFAALAVLAFWMIPDFLAVRGVAVLLLLSASPLLLAAYMEYDHPQRLLMVSLVYLAIAAALYLGASPFRLRDAFDWLFARPARARVTGAVLLGYGLLLSVVAFTY
jgi:four helix bundle protein